VTDAIRVSPFAVTHKLSCDLDETEAKDWPNKTYAALDGTIKHRSIIARYVEGQRWEDTPLFTEIYARRLAKGSARGCVTIEQLAEQYYGRVDALYDDMRRHGFREEIDREPTYFPVLIGPGGTLVIGNQGNHRLAMAKALKLDSVLVKVRGELQQVTVEFEPVTFQPELHQGAREIPAMTTEAERRAFYDLALKAAPLGTVVELGTWLGAATVFLAAGLRDAGVKSRLHAYDRFQWQAIHEYKAGRPLAQQSMYSQFRDNLGPLSDFVQAHKGEILTQRWDGWPISLLIADGPKRVREIVQVLQVFGRSLVVDAHMAWQDFAYFPAYDIPACLDPLERAGQIAFVDSVYPGTTAVFRILGKVNPKPIRPLAEWTPAQIIDTWSRWRERLAPGMRPRWMCGAAMFLCDRGAKEQGAKLFASLLKEFRDEIAPKWYYLKEKRPTVAAKYGALVAVLDAA
jgi:hypothetical protein